MELASSQPELDKWLTTKLASSQARGDVTDIITELTENCSLEELREALGRQVAGTTAQLVQATNRDYSAFVTLSAALETTHGALLKLRAPTADAVQALHNLQAGLSAQQNLRKVRYAELQREEHARAALEHYLEAYDAFTSAQDLLASTSPGPSSSSSTGSTEPAATASPAASTQQQEDVLGGIDVGIDITSALSASRTASSGLLALGSAAHAQGLGQRGRAGVGTAGAEGGLEDAEASVAALPVGLLHASGVGSLPSQGEQSSSSTSVTTTLFRAACAVRRAWSACGHASVLLKDRGALQQGQGDLTLGAVHALQRQVCAWTRGSLQPALTTATVDTARACSEDTRHRHDLSMALAAWVELGPAGPGIACAALVESLVSPALRTILSPPRLDDGLRGSLRGLARCIEEVLGLVATGGKGVQGCSIQVLLDASAGLPGYDILTSCLWTPLVATLTGPSLTPMLFTPSLPQAFHTAYTTLGQAFARLRMVGARVGLVPALEYGPACESAAGEPLLPPSVDGVQLPLAPAAHTPQGNYPTAGAAMLASPATSSLAAAWQGKLGLYAQLRGAEVSGKVGKALSARVSLEGVGPGVKIALEDLHAPGAAAGNDGLSALAALLGQPLTRFQPSPSAQQLTLPATVALWAGLQACWSPAVFLPPLLGSTVAQSAALLGRYGAWVLAAVACAAVRGQAGSVCEALGMPVLEAEGGAEGGADGGPAKLVPPPPGSASLALTAGGASSMGSGSAAAAAPVRSLQQLQPVPAAWKQQLAVETIMNAARGKGAPGQSAAAGAGSSGLPPSLTSTSSRPQVTVLTSAGEGDAVVWAAASAAMDNMLALTQDVCAVASCAPAYVLSRALLSSQGQVQGTGEHAAALAKPILGTSDSLLALLPYLLASLEATLARTCSQALVTGMRGVATAVRVGQGGKTLPKTPSPYTGAIFKPLRQALAHAAVAACGAAAGPVPRAALVCTVCCTLLASMEDCLRSALAGVQAMEASVGWLKGSGGGLPATAAGAASAGAVGVTDSDRITCQLWLDCRAVGQAVAEEVREATGYNMTLTEGSGSGTGAGAGGEDLRLVCEGALDASMTSFCLAVAQAYEGSAVKVRPYGPMARSALT